MTVYLDMVILLNFLVDYLLLLGTNRLSGYPPGWGKAALGALLGSLYAGACLLPGLAFLGAIFYRVLLMFLIGSVSFGFSVSGLRRTLVFLLLSMALGGFALAIGEGDFFSLLTAAAILTAVCTFGFRSGPGSVNYVPVELQYGRTHIRLTALCDTGNSLRDPITGRPVLVVCDEIAGRLTGLTRQQLSAPLETISRGELPGLRLIPYSAVGQPGGLLLAMRIPRVKIGKWQGSSLVAFAPERLSREGAYQALTGGMAS
ncbi:MAG: sigma-E processing peptidase SpoIIGA [Oscillospiraceae bacterium]|nr:sigma-E processing peptidase SpoIIGA [Oscillospiraceae bacterium]